MLLFFVTLAPNSKFNKRYPRLRLWKPAVNALYGSELELPRVFRDTDKHFVELLHDGAMRWRFHSDPLPLAAIYVLGERQQQLADASVEPISPVRGLMHLITHRYPESLKLDPDKQAFEFACLGRERKGGADAAN